MLKCIKIKIYGRVQGVGFRYFTKRKARLLGLAGWVKNEADGTVVGEIEGSPEKIREMLSWFEEGSPSAEVKKIETQKGDLVGFQEFEVRK